MGISILDVELQGGIQNSRAKLEMRGLCLEFYACLANYNLMGSWDVVLNCEAVNWCLGVWPRTQKPRDWLGVPQTLAQAGKVGLGVRSGSGLPDRCKSPHTSL